MQPIVLRYDVDRDLWIADEGRSRSACSDGALMGLLDGYKSRASHNGGFGSNLKKLYNQLKGIRSIEYVSGEGIVIEDEQGIRYGRHGQLSSGKGPAEREGSPERNQKGETKESTKAEAIR
jgi:hypothetical protein